MSHTYCTQILRMFEYSVVFIHRPVTLLSVLVLKGEGGSIGNGIEGGGIAEIRERGVGDFIF